MEPRRHARDLFPFLPHRFSVQPIFPICDLQSESRATFNLLTRHCMSSWLPIDLSFHRRRSLSRSALVLFLVCCTLASTFYLGVWSSLSPALSLGPVIPAIEVVDTITSGVSANSSSMNGNGNGNGSGSGEGSLPSLSSFLAGSKAAALKHLQGKNEDGRPLVMIMGNGAGGEPDRAGNLCICHRP